MSSRPNKAAITLSLTEWLTLKLRAMKVAASCDREIQPLKESFDKKCKPILDEARLKLQPIQTRLTTLEAEITKALESGIDKEKETVVLSQVLVQSEAGRATLSALAEVQVGDGDRQVEALKFFNSVKEEQRDSKFWACLKVQIGKAEKFLGDKINELAKKPKTYRVKISIPELEQKKEQKAA